MNEDEYDKIANEYYSLGKVAGVEYVAKALMEEATRKFEHGGESEATPTRNRSVSLSIEAKAMRQKHDKEFPKDTND